MKTLLTPTPLIACLAEDLNKVLTELPKGDYSVIGSVDYGEIDFKKKRLVQTLFKHEGRTFYKDYTPKNKYSPWWFDSDISFLSLLESHSLSLDKKYLIIKPK